jgi:hypothetical protein
MAKVFKIDKTSKKKIIAAYDVYHLDSKILYVVDSYRKGIYNVYTFSDNFHIGINIDGDTINQVFIKPDIENIATERYSELEKEYIEENELLSEEDLEEKFKNASMKINLAIEEFITRKNLYNNYKIAKENQIKALKGRLTNRIKEEEDLIERMRSKKMRFVLTGTEPSSNVNVDLKISAYLVNNNTGRPFLSWSISKNRENLDKLLNNTNAIFPNDELARALYEYIVITTYYIDNESLFENLFSTVEYVANEEDAINSLRRLFERDPRYRGDMRAIHKPIRETYRVQEEIRSGLRPRILNYDLIDDIDHLNRIYNLYLLLVERHKKYITTQIKDIEQDFFGLNVPLAGSKSTKQILNSVLQIERLSERIRILEEQNN